MLSSHRIGVGGLVGFLVPAALGWLSCYAGSRDSYAGAGRSEGRGPQPQNAGGASGVRGSGGDAAGGAAGSGGDRTSDRANWPVPNPASTGLPNPQSYETSVPDVVVDNVTGLTWQKNVVSDALLWSNALAYCAELQLAGRDDWRLPSLIELISIVDFTQTSPAVDPSAFPALDSGNLWTSSSLVGSPGEAFYVAFTTGFSYHGHQDFLSLQARCVRGDGRNIGISGPRYTFPSPETVFDTGTRLTWQRETNAATYSWDAAAATCGGLDLAGGGWRVPTMKELQSLLDLDVEMPALDRAAFRTTAEDSYWTSSVLADSSTEAWYVSFWIGLANTIGRDNLFWVRCVR
jgi:hypothetical protein